MPVLVPVLVPKLTLALALMLTVALAIACLALVSFHGGRLRAQRRKRKPWPMPDAEALGAQRQQRQQGRRGARVGWHRVCSAPSCSTSIPRCFSQWCVPMRRPSKNYVIFSLTHNPWRWQAAFFGRYCDYQATLMNHGSKNMEELGKQRSPPTTVEHENIIRLLTQHFCITFLMHLLPHLF